jgi:hypothetical protein
MIDQIVRDFRQPEYIHVLINPMPIYGLAAGFIGMVVAFFTKNRRAQIVALVVVFVVAASAWPALEFGEQAYDRVLSMSDDAGRLWLDEHMDRAEKLIYIYYALALLAAVAILVPVKWPRSATPLFVAVLLLCIPTLGVSGYIAYAGGKIRHREFRNVPPPPAKKSEHET